MSPADDFVFTLADIVTSTMYVSRSVTSWAPKKHIRRILLVSSGPILQTPFLVRVLSGIIIQEKKKKINRTGRQFPSKSIGI